MRLSVTAIGGDCPRQLSAAWKARMPFEAKPLVRWETVLLCLYLLRATGSSAIGMPLNSMHRVHHTNHSLTVPYAHHEVFHVMPRPLHPQLPARQPPPFLSVPDVGSHVSLFQPFLGWSHGQQDTPSVWVEGRHNCAACSTRTAHA